MKVVVNAVSAKMGGALAYLRNFLSHLRTLAGGDEYVFFIQSKFRDEFAGLPGNIRILSSPEAEKSEAARLVFDQFTLRAFAKREGADCIFSTANFGILYPPVPQVTSIRNPVYFSRDYYRHVSDVQGPFATAKVSARRRLVALSCSSSAVVVTPTEAMRDMLFDWKAADPAKCVVINHGFDRDFFLGVNKAEDLELAVRLARRGGEKVLFYPSLYGKHKNFDTLVRGIGELTRRGRDVRLILTCQIDPRADAYQARTWRIIEAEGVRDRISLIGTVSYKNMAQVYRAADVVVWPSFAESFGHPVLEAFSCRRPIVSSGIACNVEMARDAALYFDTFNPEDLADKVEEALVPQAAAGLVAAGDKRVKDFSWRRHVEEFIMVFRRLSEGGDGKKAE